MTTKPLIKALTGAGIGSRRRIADVIREGRVEVNGEIAENFKQPVDTATDRILINGHAVDIRSKEPVCLMLNKPENLMTTASDEKGRPTVLDILPPKYRHLKLHPVGRLDKDSTGLLLLTNDGSLTYRLTHPKFEHEKEYLVQISSSLKPDEKRTLERGLRLEDGMSHPARVKEVSSTPPFNYSITIHEGRKRQVRRMFEHLHHRVIALKRVRIGNLPLGTLKEGQTRQLSAQEIAKLLSQPGDRTRTPRSFQI